MAEEGRRRRRGRRRGRSEGHPSGGPPQKGREEGQHEPGDDQLEVTEESEAPGVLPPRLRFRFGRGRGREESKAGRREERREREERTGAGTPAGVSPLSFWRRGRAKSYRDQPMPKQTLGRTLRRVRGMYFPPWVPVLFIMVVVGGILVVLFVVGGAAGKPRIGQDHWHATYEIVVCGQRQPNAPTWGGGVHTHADGVVHIHPNIPSEAGAGARLVKWFEYGGGKLTQSEMRIPGRREEYKNGDTCEDGSEAVLQVFVNGERMDNWSRYIPQDGDRIRIVFGPEEEAPEEREDRTVIDEAEASRTVEVVVTGGEADAAFEPDSIELRPGETVKLVVTVQDHEGAISHIVRVAGPDGEYNTGDDFVSDPEIIEPGQQGVVVVRFDEEGEFEFQDPTAPAATGTLVVTGEPVEDTADGEPGPDAEEPVDVTIDVAMADNFYRPNQLEVEAGQTFRINLANNGDLAHNLRIAGPDGEFDTEDDLISTPSPLSGGASGELVGQIDEPGEYAFRDDFHRTEMVGTIIVK